jgi:DNA anti-recombination protein RmuC
LPNDKFVWEGDMSKSAETSSRALSDLDAFVDECIDGMSQRELRTFQKEAKQIMETAEAKASASGVPRETGR